MRSPCALGHSIVGQPRTTVLLATAILAVLASGASACKGPHWSVLLDKVPPRRESSPVIARVVIDSIRPRPSADFPRTLGIARVLNAIKGVHVGQVLKIDATATSCGGGLDDRDVGKQGFIAGRVNAAGLFERD